MDSYNLYFAKLLGLDGRLGRGGGGGGAEKGGLVIYGVCVLAEFRWRAAGREVGTLPK